jgi:hypothetical protein
VLGVTAEGLRGASGGNGLLDSKALNAAVSSELLRRSNITDVTVDLHGTAIDVDVDNTSSEAATIIYTVRRLVATVTTC